jgi:hypothetical protein
MNATTKIVSLTLVLLGAGLPIGAQDQTAPQVSPPATPTPTTSTTFANDRLEQLAAPIALYPDALVAQILMASTYPLEIVEAARWWRRTPRSKAPRSRRP